MVTRMKRRTEGTETESKGTVYWTRRKVAQLVVLLFFTIPVLYGIIMGIVEIVRSILTDIR